MTLPPQRSVRANRVAVPISRLSTVGSRAVPVAAQQTWNDLPEDVTLVESLTTFRCLLKTHLCSGSLFLTTCWTSTDYLAEFQNASPKFRGLSPKIMWAKHAKFGEILRNFLHCELLMSTCPCFVGSSSMST